MDASCIAALLGPRPRTRYIHGWGRHLDQAMVFGGFASGSYVVDIVAQPSGPASQDALQPAGLASATGP